MQVRGRWLRPPALSWPSQCSLHNAPIFRLLLKVAVKGTHQCESLNFCGALGPNDDRDCCRAGERVDVYLRTHRSTAFVESPALPAALMACSVPLTVLVQDLCYSDPVSSVLTKTTHTTAVRMLVVLSAATRTMCMFRMPGCLIMAADRDRTAKIDCRSFLRRPHLAIFSLGRE